MAPSRRVGRDARQVHTPGAVLGEEQHVQAAPEDRAGVGEVRRQDRPGLGGQERAPCLAAPIGCGADASVIEDLPDGRWRERVAEAGESP